MDDCTTCCWLRRIPNKRPDEPSDKLCRSQTWGGYIIDTAKPACEGVSNGRRTLMGWRGRLPTDADEWGGQTPPRSEWPSTP